jgi:hypothetical protein
MAMLLRGVRADHSHDGIVTFCERNILVGKVVVGLEERRGDYVLGTATEHKMEEPLGCLVKVAGAYQTFIECGVGGP